MEKEIHTLLDQLNAIVGQARYISFTYTDKKHGETSRRVMIIGASYKRLVEDSLLALQLDRRSMTGIEAIAADEMIASFKATLDGTQEGYTKQGLYVKVANGVQLNLNDGTLELAGLEQSKVVLQEGVYKTVNSAPKTLAKAKLRKGLPIGRYKTLCLDTGQFKSAKLNGETIELE